MDERAARIIVVPGETDRVINVGWEVRDRAALQRVKAPLDGAGVPFKQLSADEADARRVEEAITFEDPAGTTLEVFHGAVLDHSPVITPFGAKFITGDQGWAMSWCRPPTPTALFDFYTDVLGFRSRGAFRIPLPPEFGPIRVRFLGINERHHSLAICPADASARPRRRPHHGRGRHPRRGGPGAGPRQRRRHPAVLHAGAPHQRQDGVVLRPRTRRTGTSSSAPKACGSTKPITPQRKSPPTATGATSGSGDLPAAMRP